MAERSRGRSAGATSQPTEATSPDSGEDSLLAEAKALREAVGKFDSGKLANVVLRPGQKEQVLRVIKILSASPDVEKPVTGTVLFATIWDLVVPVLIQKGWLTTAPQKTTEQLITEGAEKLAALENAEKEAARREAQETRENQESGTGDPPAGDPPVNGETEAADAPAVGDGWVEPKLADLKVFESLKYAAKCVACGNPIGKGTRGILEMILGPDGKRKSARAWDLECREGQRFHELLMAETHGE